MVEIVEGAAGASPFEVQALVLEEDTSLVLSADAETIRNSGEHPIRLMTSLLDFEPRRLGEVLVRGTGPYRFLAIVHDLDQDPTVEEAHVAQALSEVMRLCAEKGIADLGLEPLGAIHGRLPLARFRALLQSRLADGAPKGLRRIWLITPLRENSE